MDQKPSNFSLSACIVTHAGENQICLERCLKSISSVVDEIILINDGEASEKTRELALQYHCKFFVRQKYGNCDSHRPFAFEQAKGDWILLIDADEFLPTVSKGYIRKLIQSGKAHQYNFLWRLWDGKKYVTQTWPHKPVLLHKKSLEYLGILHPFISVKGRVLTLSLPLEHRPLYNNFSLVVFSGKWLKWMPLHASHILTPIHDLPQYQFSGTCFPKHIEWIKKFDIYIAPIIFLYLLEATFSHAPWFQSFTIYKYSFLQAMYYFLLCFEVRRQKKLLKK